MNKALSRTLSLTAILFLQVRTPFFILTILDLKYNIVGQAALQGVNFGLRCTLMLGSAKPVFYIICLEKFRMTIRHTSIRRAMKEMFERKLSDTGPTSSKSSEGPMEGTAKGATKGSPERTTKGSTEGTTEGMTEWAIERMADEMSEGTANGTTERTTRGSTEGTTEETTEEMAEWAIKGMDEGMTEGTSKDTTEEMAEEMTEWTTVETTEGLVEGTTKGTHRSLLLQCTNIAFNGLSCQDTPLLVEPHTWGQVKEHFSL